MKQIILSHENTKNLTYLNNLPVNLKVSHDMSGFVYNTSTNEFKLSFEIIE